MSGLIKRLLFAGLWVFTLFAFAQQRGEVDRLLSTYKLGFAGDVVSIRVLGEDDLKREKIRLSDAGTISFPIIGEIRVLGKRVVELETLIADGLRGKYLLNPVVSVTIEEYRPSFVNGQVEKVRRLSLSAGADDSQGSFLAGGFKERASKEKIFVIREDDKSQTPVKVDQSALVYPGDIITVEESFF
jgi:protein involved in polysaccharide export with SLBB domain